MTSNRRFLFAGAFLASLSLGTGAIGADAVAPVSVDSLGATFTVKISSPVGLNTVLQALCERAEASCKLPADLPAQVQPRTIRGSWPDVVADLLHGSDLRFAVTPAVPGRSPYLVVEPAAAAVSGAVSGAPVEAPAEAPTVEAEAAPAEASPTAESSNDATAAAPTMSPDSPLVNAATAAATPGVSFAVTPFADSQGNPIMSRVGANAPGGTVPGQAVLPWADEAGNAMVVPITNAPLSLTPFLGPDGEAWPAPVAQPNQKLQYPIPPTFPPAGKTENK